MNIELQETEVREVTQILTERLMELRQEVVHADVSTYRDALKRREELIRSILARFESTQATEP